MCVQIFGIYVDFIGYNKIEVGLLIVKNDYKINLKGYYL